MTRRIAPVIAVVAAFYAVFVPLRIHESGVVSFIHIGQKFLQSAHTSSAIDTTGGAESTYGYDGQFYYFIAADPSRGRDYMHYGTDDQSGIRYARIGYPLAARALALGQRAAVPYALLLVNLVAVLAGTLALAVWLRRNGRSPWYAALYGLWPGISYALFRDLSEPLAYCFVAFAILFFDAHNLRRLAASAGFLALALLTRETTIAFVFGLAFTVWFCTRNARRSLVYLVASVAPVVVWRAIVTAWLHVTTFQHTETGWKALVPFYGMRSWWPWDADHWLIFWTVIVPFLLIGAGALWLLRRREAVAAAVVYLLNCVVFVVFLPHEVSIDWGAAGRNVTPVLIAALLLAPTVRSRPLRLTGALLLSPVWFVLIGWAVGGSIGTAPIDLMTR